jgi:hypothetical protein
LIIVLTCPRSESEKPWPYVGATLSQIDRENIPGLRKSIVVDRCRRSQPADPDDVEPNWMPPELESAASRGWYVDYYDEPHLRGNKWGYWHALELGAKSGEDLLLFEDDLLFCRNAVRRMSTFPVPGDLALVSFFSPRVLQTASAIPGLWRPPRFTYFTQAIKFSASTLQALVEYRKNPGWTKFNASDNALMLALTTLGLRYGVHAPDLVDHVGAISECTPSASLEMNDRRSKMFPGPDWDALQLYSSDELYR